MQVKPIVVAMILCTNVDRQGPDGLYTIHGVFWTMEGIPAFPYEMDHHKVYIVLAGLRGATDLKLRLSSAGEEFPVQWCKITVPANSPIDYVQIVTDLQGWTINAPGVWFLDLCDEAGAILLSRRLNFRQASR